MFNLPKFFFVLLLSIFFSSLSNAQNKVVVIPLLEDGASPLHNVITVSKSGGDFTDPLEALASINDASKTNPYIIVVGPGRYLLEATLHMKDYVSLQGSGVNATHLIRTIPNNSTTLQNSAVISTANYSTISDLKVTNSTSANWSIGLYIEFFNSSIIQNVDLIVRNGNISSIGIQNEGILINSRISNISIDVTGGVGTNNSGVYSLTTNGNFENIKIHIEGRQDSKNYGFFNELADINLRDVVITTGVNGENYGIYATGDNATYPNTTIIRNSKIHGATAGLYTSDPGSAFNVSHSTISGGTNTNLNNTALGSGIFVCTFNDNGGGVQLDDTCAIP